MEMAASHLLAEMVPDGVPGAEKAIARWQSVDARSRKPLWGRVLAGLMIAVTAIVVVKDFHEVVRYVKWRGWLGGQFFGAMPEPDERVMAHLKPHQKLLLQGKVLGGDQFNIKEALWRSEPENPAFYAEYATAYVGEHDRLPGDFLETVSHIDPQNAWFTFLAAAVEAKESVKRNKRKSSRVAGKIVFAEPVSWQILDQAKMDKALDLIRQAELQEKFDSYSSEMFCKRIALLPDTNLIEHLDRMVFAAMSGTSNSLRLRFLGDVIAAGAWRAAEAGDKQGFLEAQKLGQQYLDSMMQSEPSTLLDELILNVVAVGLAESFASGFEKLGIVEDAKRWRMISDRLDSRNQGRGSREFIVDGEPADPAIISGGMFGSTVTMVAKQPEHQPELKDADLEPSRMLDHDILSRFFGYLSWIWMGFCLVAVALYRFRVSRLAQRLALRIEQQLETKDWAWVLGAGLLLPFIYVMVVNRFTPLGGRQFGMLGTAMLLPAAHFFGLMVLWLTVPIQVARWRLARRAGALGFRRASWSSWIAVICAAAFVPFIGWAAISHHYPEFWLSWMTELFREIPRSVDTDQRFWIAVGFLGVPVLWLIFCVSCALLSQTHRIIQHAVVARMLVKSYLATMLLLALATIGFKASEGYWFTRETLGKLDPAKPGGSAFEYDVAVQMRKELREILQAGGS